MRSMSLRRADFKNAWDRKMNRRSRWCRTSALTPVYVKAVSPKRTTSVYVIAAEGEEVSNEKFSMA